MHNLGFISPTNMKSFYKFVLMESVEALYNI